MSRICAFALLLAVSPAFAHAEVVVRTFDEPHKALGKLSVGLEGVCRDRI